jgi:hypothetical protein
VPVKLSHDAIATRAEAIWRQMGCPQGRDGEIWLKAESELGIRHTKKREGMSGEFTDRLRELDELHPGAGGGRETTSL